MEESHKNNPYRLMSHIGINLGPPAWSIINEMKKRQLEVNLEYELNRSTEDIKLEYEHWRYGRIS